MVGHPLRTSAPREGACPLPKASGAAQREQQVDLGRTRPVAGQEPPGGRDGVDERVQREGLHGGIRRTGRTASITDRSTALTCWSSPSGGPRRGRAPPGAARRGRPARHLDHRIGRQARQRVTVADVEDHRRALVPADRRHEGERHPLVAAARDVGLVALLALGAGLAHVGGVALLAHPVPLLGRRAGWRPRCRRTPLLVEQEGAAGLRRLRGSAHGLPVEVVVVEVLVRDRAERAQPLGPNSRPSSRRSSAAGSASSRGSRSRPSTRRPRSQPRWLSPT